MLVTLVQFYCHCSSNAGLAIFPGKRTSNDMKEKKKNRKYPSKMSETMNLWGKKIMQFIFPPTESLDVFQAHSIFISGPPHHAFIAIKQSHLLIPCMLLKSTNTSPTHIQIPPNGGVLVMSHQWQARKESPREGGPLYLGPLPNQCSRGPWLCSLSQALLCSPHH